MNSHKKIYCFCLPFLFCLAGNLSAQNKTISIDVKNVNLEQFFNIVEKQTSYKFSYRNSILDEKQNITLKMENVSIDDVLNTVLVPKGLKYSIASEYLIVITKAGTGQK